MKFTNERLRWLATYGVDEPGHGPIDDHNLIRQLARTLRAHQLAGHTVSQASLYAQDVFDDEDDPDSTVPAKSR